VIHDTHALARTSLRVALALALGLACGCAGAPPPEQQLTADPPLGDGPPGPAVGEARTALARAAGLVKAEKYADARPEIEKALAVAPSAEGYFYLGVVKEKTGDRAGAEVAYREAIKLDPTSPEAALNLAALYLDEPPRPDDAVGVLKAALVKSPGNPDLEANLGYALGLLHDADGATRAFEAAIAKKSDPETELLFGTMLVENKRGDRAGEHLKKGAAAVKGDPASLATYGRMLGGAHLFAECVATFDKAIAQKKDAAEFYVRRGTCRHELSDEPGAAQDFQKATAIQPDFAAAHYYLGLSLIAQKKNLPGARELEKAAKLGAGTPIGAFAAEKLKTAFGKK
jgi:Flp pilus assembly protein TadD